MSVDRLAHPFTADHDLSAEQLNALLGGKGAGLVTMTARGIPVPPGFTMTTEACREYLGNGWSNRFDAAVADGIETLQATTGKVLGSVTNPLLVSVRSGASVSMPGMMDTVLNVGMNRAVAAGLAELTGNPAFAEDTNRRAMIGFAEIVLGAPDELLKAASEPGLGIGGTESILAAAGYDMPEDPVIQITMAVRAVFDSWLGERAVHYRRIEGIDAELGTAATVQSMVFGNLGDDSGTGVAFSRNPTTGQAGLVGDFLARAQGEDVVAGGATTETLADMAGHWPETYRSLEETAAVLEQWYTDMVDLEFTVEAGRLWLLQARRGKRTPVAAFRVAIDMAEDPSFPLDRAGAVDRCVRYLDDPPTIPNPEATSVGEDTTDVANGLGASPGVATGVLCLDPDRAVELKDRGASVILAREATSPADVHGMAASVGLFTTLGGQVSHAALVAREWGIPAVVGAAEAKVVIGPVGGSVVGPSVTVEEGDVVSVDGDTGRLVLGTLAADRVVAPEVEQVRQWAAAAATAQGPAETAATTTTSTATTSAVPTAAAGAADPGLPSTDGRNSALPPLSDRVLHALRIKGMLTAEAAAAICDSSGDEAVAALTEAVTDGLATFMEPRTMWLISPDGRTRHPEILAAMVDGVDLGRLPYERFLGLNDDFKRLCTDWQLRDGEPNDHSDPAYDAAILDRLAKLDHLAQPVVAEIGAIATWMAPYGPRLQAARHRLVDGDQKALTGVMCDSYHEVWMELHEDLILTQGIDRAAEGST